MILNHTSGPLKGRIKLPASKSISNRVLMIQAMCEEAFPINTYLKRMIAYC
ncbi:hypothetical protein EMGBS15_02140 [Filimonas sp.]|nr:hypothetical protein EMGBS15_02140 [Filimonas sp.]